MIRNQILFIHNSKLNFEKILPQINCLIKMKTSLVILLCLLVLLGSFAALEAKKSDNYFNLVDYFNLVNLN